MNIIKLSIAIGEKVYNYEPKHSLLSFIGYCLNVAKLNSSKELSEPLTVQINGKPYKFRDKDIALNYESKPQLSNSNFTEATENSSSVKYLKLNFVGFCLNSSLSGLNSFNSLNLVKNKPLNEVLQNCKSLSGIVTALLLEYKQKQTLHKIEVDSIKIQLIEKGLIDTTLLEKAKQLKIELGKVMGNRNLPNTAKEKNLETRQKRNAKKETATT